MDCYDKILSYYEQHEDLASDSSRVWLHKFLVKLMHEFNKAPDYLRVRNCLILLVNLFFNIEFPDHYHNKGDEPEKLRQEDRDLYLQLLRQEIDENN